MLRRGVKVGILQVSLSSAGESGTGAGVTEGAIVGAGVTMLLVLCFGFIFFV